jgi:hypothetical protein
LLSRANNHAGLGQTCFDPAQPKKEKKRDLLG